WIMTRTLTFHPAGPRARALLMECNMAVTEVVSARLRRPSQPARPPVQFDLRTITAPILLHLLRGRVRFPRLFLLTCKLTAGRFRRSIDPQFPVELIDTCTLPLWVYINLKSRLGQKTA